jgi:hypothetical protein
VAEVYQKLDYWLKTREVLILTNKLPVTGQLPFNDSKHGSWFKPFFG